MDVKLCHSWICSTDDSVTYNVVAKELVSYNRVVEAVIAGQIASSPQPTTPVTDDTNKAVMKGIICSQFLDENSSQITRLGLEILSDLLPSFKPAVFFRNNHFSTIVNVDGRSWTLGIMLIISVTDQGFSEERDIVWESVALQGNSEFVDAHFGKKKDGINQPEDAE